VIDAISTQPAAEAELQRLLWTCYATNFSPHPGQVRALQALAEGRFAGLYCGRRWGKSKLLARVAVRAVLDPQRICWLIAPNYELTRRVFRPTAYLLKHVLPRSMVAAGMPPVRVIRSVDSNSERLLELSNGSLLQAKSADSPESLLGEGVHCAILDESARIEERIWEEYILPGLLDTNGRSVHATTPQGYDWNHENFLRGQDGPEHSEDWRTIQSPSWENTYLPADAVDRFRSIMSKSSFAQEIAAAFTARSGRVFSDFDRNVHVRSVPFVPWNAGGGPVIVGLDFGFLSFAWVAAQVCCEEELRIFADRVEHDLTTAQAIERLRACPWMSQAQEICCDPAGIARNLQTGESDVKLLREAFPNVRIRYSMHPPHRSPEWRAAHLRDRLLAADGKTIRLYVDKSCRETVRMFEESVYPESAKDEPAKDGKVDHIRDALGYLEAVHFHVRSAVISARRWG
jgi:hypothetical protein